MLWKVVDTWKHYFGEILENWCFVGNRRTLPKLSFYDFKTCKWMVFMLDDGIIMNQRWLGV